jgi:hypothetical protein
MTTRLLRQSRPLITIERVVAALVVVLIGFTLLAWFEVFDAGLLYLIFVIVTAFVVRSVDVEPGTWLGLRAVRRGLVVVIALIAADFLTMRAMDFSNVGISLLVPLALGDVALGRATRRIASADSDRIDERQEALRNRAHRIAYAILAVSVGLVVVLAEVANAGTRRWLADALGGGAVVTFIQMLFFLPAMVIAWIEPDRIADEDGSRMPRNIRARIAYGMVTFAVVLPVLMSLLLAAAPLRVSAFTRPEPDFATPNGTVAHCNYFDARTQAGVGFGATTRIAAVACWDSRTAFEEWGLNSSDCYPYRTEFVSASTIDCRRTAGSDGSLHFTYRTVVRSAILPFVSHEVVMTLNLTKDGKVVQFP